MRSKKAGRTSIASRHAPAESANSFPVRKPVYRIMALLFSGTLLAGVAYAQESVTPQANSDPQNPTTANSSTKPGDSDKKSASDSKDGSARRLETVTVTAEKREENAQDVATSINVLSGDKLLNENIGKSAQEVLNYIPNASAFGSQHGRPRWWIRGIGTGNQQGDSPNPVGTYLDDVYISNASATGFPLFDQERVEVLNGPQGTLWGKNTTGGAVNFISKKPSFDSDGYFKTSYGTFNDKLVEGAYGGTIVPDTVAARISFHTEDQGPRYTNLTTGGREGSLKDSALRAQVLAIISPDLDVNFNYHYRNYSTRGATSQSQGTGPNGAYYQSNSGVPLFSPSTSVNAIYGLPGLDGNAWNKSDTEQQGFNVTANYQWGRNTLTSITGYEDYRVVSTSDGSTPFTSSSGTTFSYSNYNEHQLSQELRLASPKEDKLSWIGGLYYFSDNILSITNGANLAGFTAFNPTGGTTTASTNSLTLSGYSHKTISRAIFGSSTYNFTDRFDTTIGWRWTTEYKAYDVSRAQYTGTTFGNQYNWYNSIANAGTLTGAGTTSFGPTGLSQTWDAVTYDFTPTYKLNATDRTYYRYAHGIKSGGFNTSVSSISQIYAVQPEVLDSQEIGYKSEWADGRVLFNAALFTYNISNYQINVSGPYGQGGNATTVLTNAQSGHARGAEFTLEALPTDRLHINANLGLLYTKFDQLTSNVSFANFDFSGDQFVRSPHINTMLQADYRLPVWNGGSVVFGGDARYQSKQYYYVNFQNYPQTGQGGYTLLNGRVSYNTPKDRDTISLFVNNLANKVYLAHAGVVNQTAFQTGWGATWGAPRTVGVSYVSRFN
jgi:iron complex outermembrane receptor protein